MSAPNQDAKSFLRRVLPKVLLSLVVGGLFAWLSARGGVPLVPSREAFSHVASWAIPVYTLIMIVSHIFRATRWRFLIAPVKAIPVRDVVALNFVGFFAIFALPFRLGEVVRPALTKVKHGVPISAGVGTVAVERVIDGLVASICVAWGLFAVPHLPVDDPIARALPTYGYTALVVFGCAFVALGLFLWQKALAAKLAKAIIGIVSPKLGELIASKLGTMADGLRCLADPKLAAGFLGETILYWAANAFGMWVLAVGCGLPLAPEHGVAIMGILAIGILLPAGPGLFGSFQLAVSTGLKIYVAESMVGVEGAAYVFLLYVIQAVVITIAGLAPLYFTDISLSDVLSSEPKAENLPEEPAQT
jgi:uncharacterized protein (TIRG00374 family)